uniref:catalase family protein n=1 Tax=Bradyrhizobium sp. (strain ORS 278) TaxID=114615 RepID=UPI001FCB9D61|nr:catalase family protein [Bradyrhizobium sp. ORS 278]
MIRAIVASVERTSATTFATYKHGLRQQHAKGVGYLRGELTVYEDLPSHLRQGLFAQPTRYPVIVRFSTALGAIKSDRIRVPRGFAIKVLGVSGAKALADDDTTSQDLLLVNHPSYIADARSYLEAQRKFERTKSLPDLAVRAVGLVSRVLLELSTLVRLPLPIIIKALGDPGHHILGETFHTEGAIRFGDFVARLRAVPVSPALRRLTGQPSHDGDDVVRQSVVSFFRTEPAEYELQAQLCTDLRHTPIEDSSIDWPEDFAPPQPIANIRLPAQVADSPARRAYVDDVLSFDPWRCLAAHQPLGSVMRMRRDVYRTSRVLRQQQNAALGLAPPNPTEPRDIAELPD